MVELIQIFAIIFEIFALSRVFININNKNLSKLESLFWLLFWSLAIFVTLFPSIIGEISIILGVGRAVDLIIYSALVLLAYLIFRIYAKLTKMERNITKIVRRIAIKK